MELRASGAINSLFLGAGTFYLESGLLMFEAHCCTLTICVTLSMYNMADAVLDAGDTVRAVNEIDKALILMELILKWDRQIMNRYMIKSGGLKS